MAFSMTLFAWRRSRPARFAERASIHSPFCRSSSPGTVVPRRSATWLTSGVAPVVLATGIFPMSPNEVILACGTCTCT